jgi:hypothetical protein
VWHARRLRDADGDIADVGIRLGRERRDDDRRDLDDRGRDDLVDALADAVKWKRREHDQPSALILTDAIEKRPAVRCHGADVDRDVLVPSWNRLCVERVGLDETPFGDGPFYLSRGLRDPHGREARPAEG